MSEQNKGRRQQRQQSAISRWLQDYKSWVSGMTRGERIRYRCLQGAVAISIVIILVWAVLNVFLQPPELPAPPQTKPGDPSSSSSEEIDWDVENPHISQSGRKEGVYTFLVAGRDVVGGGTDTMLLLTFDSKEKTLSGLNLPRDTMVNVSYTYKRLNNVYSYTCGSDPETKVEKGMNGLKEHVAKLTGITPDYYVYLEWEAIGQLVDALGGVEFEVPFLMDYKDPYQDLYIYQEPGYRLLSGEDAMQVIRWRKNSDGSNSQGDVGRLAIQQDFLKAVAKKCLQPATFLKIPDLAKVFTDNVKTDLTVGNILAFAKLAYGMNPETGVSFQTAPLASSFFYNEAALVTLDPQGILEIVNSGMNPYQRDIELGDLEMLRRNGDGSFSVTSGTLADASLAQPNAGGPKKEEPEEIPEKQPESPQQPSEELQQPVEDPEMVTDPTEPPSESGQPQEGENVQAEPPTPQEPSQEEIPEPLIPEPPQPEQGGQTETVQDIPEWEIPVIE